MRLRVALLAAVASLAGAASASADTFTVTGGGDNSIPGGCAPAGPAAWTCNSLRGAVNAANANPPSAGVDAIVIDTPTVTLSVGAVQITSDTSIIGLRGPRNHVIDATGAQAPAFEVSGNAEATFGNVTIQRGTGGNVVVLEGSSAGFSFARVTRALSGPGIVNEGSTTLAFSLVDSNPGGGIENVGGVSQTAALIVGSSTVAGNTGNGIQSTGAANTVDLMFATVGRNTGIGLSFDSQQEVGVNNSIVAGNGTNCNGATVTAQFSVEGTNTCGFSPTENRINTDPSLSATLVPAGGATDVLTIPATSPAANLVPGAFCQLTLDQRGFVTPGSQPCDAGAYDHDGVDPGTTQPPPPPPDPPAPPAPTPTPEPTPTPVVNQTAVAREQSGTVKIQLPRTKTFVDLDATRGIPMGSTIDTRKGAVAITTVPKPGAPPETAIFKDGLFKLTQRGGITNLTLVEELDCKKGKRASASQKAKKPKKRKLWGDGKGAFRTTGRYSAATVRGTRWLVEDTCTTTTTRVTQGSVTVQHGKKRIVVRAGKKYVARAKKR